VLFGDLTGFTSLSENSDPEATHDLLNRYFESVDGVIGAYGGTIDKHIGDGIMAVFGAPTAHSDDPERAMRSAMAIHEVLAKFDPPLTAHVGIASGTVVASGTGSETHREYTVIGDSVNLAARLQDRAAPGETLISRAVYDLAGARFDCSPLKRNGSGLLLNHFRSRCSVTSWHDHYESSTPALFTTSPHAVTAKKRSLRTTRIARLS
jgi:class 3 adenylate cyclase